MSEHDRLAKLSSQDDLKEKVRQLYAFGPRQTGNDAHARLIRWISDELKSLGLQAQAPDTCDFERWAVASTDSACSLSVESDGGKISIPIAAAHPYSGRTDASGVTAPLHLVTCPYWWFGCAGKIAVIEVPNPGIPLDVLIHEIGRLPANAANIPDSYAHPVLSALAFGPALKLAKWAGAVGVVAVWKDLKAADANHQYVPFSLPYRDIPTVWVASESGPPLLALARQGARATLVLKATLEKTSTNTVWAIVKGEIANETILVITHTDGVNAVEENGAIGLIELARMFADGPCPKRTLVFIFLTGHLRIPEVTKHLSAVKKFMAQAATAWLAKHPEWWSGENGGARAIAGLVIEHLGALSRVRSSQSEKIACEPELTYATNETMQRIMNQAWAGRTTGTVLMAEPNGIFQIGEGEPLYKNGIPAISLASVPQYLLAVTDADVVDTELMHEQIGAFAHALLLIDGTATETLGRANQASWPEKLAKFLQACPDLHQGSLALMTLGPFPLPAASPARQDRPPF